VFYYAVTNFEHEMLTAEYQLPNNHKSHKHYIFFALLVAFLYAVLGRLCPLQRFRVLTSAPTPADPAS
jgi:hypothetical protein